MFMKIAKEVFEYLDGHPTIKSCLKAGLINHSALARKIASELRLNSTTDFDAILVASKRFADKARPASEIESKIIKYIRNGKFEMRNKVSVFILPDDSSVWDKILALAKKVKAGSNNFHLIQGAKTMTVVLDDDFAQELEETFHGQIIRERKSLVQITHRTSEKIEEENGINIYECVSSWTDSIFLIEEKDAQKAFALLNVKG